MKRLHIWAFCTAALPILLLAGCNKSEESAADLKPAALVNGRPITVNEVEDTASKLGAVAGGESQALANRVLNNAVDQEILAQAAVKAKLDEQPELEWKLATAKREILAQAELETLTKDVKAPTESEVKAYYEAHPELFSTRKVYQLITLVAKTTTEDADKARELAAKGRDPKALMASLQAAGIPVAGQQVVKGAEQLPADMLAKLAALKPGQSVTVEGDGRLNVIFLAGVQEQPVTLAQASPSIERYLENDKKRQVIEAELKKMRTQTKIEYRSPYGAVESGKQ